MSDDDFARTVIAQEWVASARGEAFLHALPAFRERPWVRVVDPSGTSWLPFPFWWTGLTMLVFGRGLAVARAAQLVLVTASTVLLGRALLRARFGRIATASILLLGFANPYALWASASLTPDAWVALLIATALVSLVEKEPDLLAVVALLVACLSRYEAWPVAAVFVLRYRRPRALVPLLAPLGWVAWNWAAHGSPVHFFTRVAKYREAHDALPLSARAAFVPHAYVELFGLGLGLLVAVGALLVLVPSLRRAWGWVPAGCTALLGFLVVGSLGDGAPTHHAARAQLSLSWVGAALLMIALGWLMQRVQIAWGSKAGAIVVSALGFCGVLWAAALPARVREWPGRGEADRSVQLARGAALRTERPEGFALTPCRYEHLALMAAYEAPERISVTEAASGDPSRCSDHAPRQARSFEMPVERTSHGKLNEEQR